MAEAPGGRRASGSIRADFFVADSRLRGALQEASITIRFQTTRTPYQYEIQRMT